jgi:hypothetical protein
MSHRALRLAALLPRVEMEDLGTLRNDQANVLCRVALLSSVITIIINEGNFGKTLVH